MTAECHELTTHADGRVELAYLGARPWHGLGQSIAEGASIEETQTAAGMDWKIKRGVVQFSAPSTDAENQPVIETRAMPGRVVLYRDDTLEPLGVVSKSYNEVQPAQALEFFRSMVEAGGYTMESAGTMRGGARFFAVAKLAAGFTLPGDDRVEGRILFATGCDGTMSTTVRPISLRVICRNTLRAAISGAAECISVRHSTVFDAESVRHRLRALDAQFDAFAGAAEALAATRMSVANAESMLCKLLPAPLNGGAVSATRGFTKIMDLFNGSGMGATLPSSSGTAWGLLNAVTEYTDHHTRSRNEGVRQESALFGVGGALKSRALDLLLTT